MKGRNKKKLCIAVIFIFLFIFWTFLISFVDVKSIGPLNSEVGLATINTFVHNLTGENLYLYNITDWLGLVPLGIMVGFAVFGLVQLIKRKNITKVDRNILVLGGFYVIVIAMYMLFEVVVVNYRPLLINGVLEASYPSSTTILVMSVMPTAIKQMNIYIKNKILRKTVSLLIISFVVFMVGARFVSGVHWVTDIIGGFLLGIGLVLLHNYIIDRNI